MFRTEALRQRIELIIHLIEFGRQLILIQGAAGLGKTTLLNAIEQSADPSWVFIRTTAGATLKRENLLGKIAANLDFEPSGDFSEEEIIGEIQRRLEILENNNQIAILLIDDAHELPNESHSLLLELAHRDDDSTELRVVLAADNSESSLLDYLQANAKQNALIHTVDMPAMDRDQTASLISWWHDQELNGDDGLRQRLFTAGTIDEIFAQSAGVPGDILVLARQKWLSGQNVELRPDPVKKYIVLGALALLVIGVFTFFGKDTKEPEIEDMQIELPEASQEPPVVALPEQTDAIRELGVKERPAEAQNKQELPESETTKTVPLAEERLNDSRLDTTLRDTRRTATPPPLVADDGLDSMLAATLAEEVIADIPEKQSPSPAAANPDNEQTSTLAAPAPDEKLDPQAGPAPPKEQSEKPVKANSENLQPKVSVTLRSKPSEATPTKKSPSKQSAMTVAPAPAPEPYTLANLLRHTPDGYVLQLFGVRNHDAATKYLKKHNLETNSTVVASLHEGEPWFVVIHGRYPTREAASKAAKTLSKKLENINPWPRPVTSLK